MNTPPIVSPDKWEAAHQKMLVKEKEYMRAGDALAAERRELDEPEIADALAQAFVELRVLRLHNWRTLSRLGRGVEPGAESSWVKLAWTDMTQHLSDGAMDVVGEAGPLWSGAADNPGAGTWQRQWRWSKAASIAGGTSEIKRNQIGERILGLPRDPLVK